MHSTTKTIKGLNKDIDSEFDFNKITNVSLDGLDHSDYPDYCDAFIDSADYDGKKMTDEELDALNEDYELVYELVWNNLH